MFYRLKFEIFSANINHLADNPMSVNKKNDKKFDIKFNKENIKVSDQTGRKTLITFSLQFK